MLHKYYIIAFEGVVMKETKTFYKRLKMCLPNHFHIPKKYKRLGNLVILRANTSLDPAVGDAVLTILPWAEGVFQHETTEGETRHPKLRHLAGSDNTVVIHHENHVKYNLDISKTTFSAGNSALRRRLVHEIQEGDNLLDMFAAVGNLCLQPAAFNMINLLAIEKDPITCSYLTKTMELNHINNYRIINSDCRNIIVNDWADKVLMGYHWVDFSHLQVAVQNAKSKFVLYIHPLARVKNYQEQVDKYNKYLRSLNVTIDNLRIKKIKHYSPMMDHIELTYFCKK